MFSIRSFLLTTGFFGLALFSQAQDLSTTQENCVHLVLSNKSNLKDGLIGYSLVVYDGKGNYQDKLDVTLKNIDPTKANNIQSMWGQQVDSFINLYFSNINKKHLKNIFLTVDENQVGLINASDPNQLKCVVSNIPKSGIPIDSKGLNKLYKNPLISGVRVEVIPDDSSSKNQKETEDSSSYKQSVRPSKPWLKYAVIGSVVAFGAYVAYRFWKS